MRQTRGRGAKAQVIGVGAITRPGELWSGLAWLQWFFRGLSLFRSALAREAEAFDLTAVIAVGLGVGVALYFAAPEEPGLAGPSIAFVGMTALAYRLRGHWWLYVICVGLTAITAGFLAGRVRTISVMAPQLSKPITLDVSALILSVEPRGNGSARLIVRPITFGSMAASEAPAKIRVTVQRAGLVQAGESVRFKAVLRPPPLPAVPGGFDFARDAFFDGIGGVGFVAGKLHPVVEPAQLSSTERFAAWLDRARNQLTSRIAAAIPGENGAIAAALVTGKRGLIPDETNQALRASGLYHVVSISGLHMALFASGLFWLIRALLAFSARLALTMPLKSIAASLSLLPAAAYTIFSGGEVATIRAFIMTAIVLCAIALGRSAITRRNVAIAASLVLLTTPEELLGPSFQMSFAAVAMLVAWYDRPRSMGAPARFQGLTRIVLGLFLTTLIASFATAPFAAYHFHRLTLQSLASNVVATPLVSILIMPLAFLALVAEPFGYGAPVWQAMGVAVKWFMAVARLVASWPGADIIVPRVPSLALMAFGLSLLMLAVLRTRLALAAMVPTLVGVALCATVPRPTVIVGANGHAALVQDGKHIHVIATKADAFAVQEWLLAMGDRRKPDDPSLAEGVLCDQEGCSAPLGRGLVIILDKTANAIEEDCNRAAILVSPLAIPTSCTKTGLTIDKLALEQAGSIEVYREEDGDNAVPNWRMVHARSQETSRPWSPIPSVPKPQTQPMPQGAVAPDADLMPAPSDDP